MTTVETISIVSALFGITLAVVAILFTWRVHEKDQELNLKFTETLTSINEKSTATQAALDRTVNRIVEAFIETRTTGSSSVSFPTSGEQEGEQRTTELARLAHIEEQIEALSLRQRFQVASDLRPFYFSDVAEGSEENLQSFAAAVGRIPGVSSVAFSPYEKSGSMSRSRFWTNEDRSADIQLFASLREVAFVGSTSG